AWLVALACDWSIKPVLLHWSFSYWGSGILQCRPIRAQTCWTTWPQPIPCLSAIQWHAGKEGSQPEKGMDEMQYIMSGVASVADSDGRRLTCVSGL
uniref:Ig-like domain-containing protein n=1 Tax=Mesocestoides corti TaxID=53468 RepID=A0A5K3F2D4_MESCO